MPTSPHLVSPTPVRLVAPAAAPAVGPTAPLRPSAPPRLRPEERRRTPVRGRRARVAVMGRPGPGALADVDLLRLARVADVRVHARDEAPGRATAARLLAGVDLLVVAGPCLPALDAPLLDELSSLRGLVLQGTDHDHIDVDLLAARRIELEVLPDGATPAVAEHALGLLRGLTTRPHGIQGLAATA